VQVAHAPRRAHRETAAANLSPRELPGRPRAALTSTKLILSGFLGVLACFALVLIGAIAGNRGAVSVTVTLLGIAALGLVVVLIILAAGFVLAMRGLYRQPDLRTWSNIALAIGGLGGLALALVMLASALAARGQL